ncbi:MAG: NADP-dependent fatty aldehyde dehydrogenase [Planctomycetota bacterium]|jgi:NADP-dependent aldehyde dehydrogenase
MQPVLINGAWTQSSGTTSFQAVNPTSQQPMPQVFPVSPWSEIDAAIAAAAAVSREIRGWPGTRIAEFLERYALEIEARTDLLVETAHAETGLPRSPRLRDGELPRTTNQLRQAAGSARDESWRVPTIDTATNIRSMFGALGPVVVFGPNNFPYAYNGIAGGDFAAAIAAGNPVIAKGHPCHPETTRIFGEAAVAALHACGMPPALVQLIYRTSHEDGLRLVSDPRIGGVGYTGARQTGLRLKAAADAAGKPIYLELSSINPVFMLAGALRERLDKIADEFATSCLMGAGQFCTNPGLIVVPAGAPGDAFTAAAAQRFAAATPGTMLSEGVRTAFLAAIRLLQSAGAQLVTGGEAGGGNGVCCRNTLLKVSAKHFMENPHTFQTEAFGNGSLIVHAESPAEMLQLTELLEGNLTGSIYTDTQGSDDADYVPLAAALRTKVGRLLNDKMPTGVAVVASMNHGGPFPATGHPGFTAVGVPASVTRFGMLQCYDAIRPHRLPPVLQDRNPGGIWRRINGAWSQADVG